jgi:hypothetical protein
LLEKGDEVLSFTSSFVSLRKTWATYPVKISRNGKDLWHILQYNVVQYHTAWVNHIADHFEDKLNYYIFFNLWHRLSSTEVSNDVIEEERTEYEDEDEGDRDSIEWEKLGNFHIWKLTTHIIKKITGDDTRLPVFVKHMNRTDRMKIQMIIKNVLR